VNYSPPPNDVLAVRINVCGVPESAAARIDSIKKLKRHGLSETYIMRNCGYIYFEALLIWLRFVIKCGNTHSTIPYGCYRGGTNFSSWKRHDVDGVSVEVSH
jgi:hypothetical protein